VTYTRLNLVRSFDGCYAGRTRALTVTLPIRGLNTNLRARAVPVAALKIAAGVLLGLVGFYGLMRIFQAASLFTGARALSNFNFWASVWFLAYGTFVAALSRPWRLVHRLSNYWLVAAAVSLFFGCLWLVLPLADEFVAIDSCLDSGGSFDYVRSVCDHSRSHPYIGLGWRSGFRFTLSLSCLAVAWHVARHVRANNLAKPTPIRGAA